MGFRDKSLFLTHNVTADRKQILEKVLLPVTGDLRQNNDLTDHHMKDQMSSNAEVKPSDFIFLQNLSNCLTSTFYSQICRMKRHHQRSPHIQNQYYVNIKVSRQEHISGSEVPFRPMEVQGFVGFDRFQDGRHSVNLTENSTKTKLGKLNPHSGVAAATKR